MTKIKISLICLFGLIVAAFFIFDLGQYISLDFFKSQQSIINNYYHNNPIKTALIFFGTYVLITSLSLPAAAAMTLVGGAIFGVIWGLLLVSFASSIGATIAFLFSRYLFRESIQDRFSDKLQKLNAGIKKEGAFYLFTLRMVPIFPYFIINAVMGLTPIRTTAFFIVTQLGMLPATAVYVNAGVQISRIESLSDILSPEIIASFVLLGIFPLIAKKTLELIKSRRPAKAEDLPIE